jgi:hypothetical protein
VTRSLKCFSLPLCSFHLTFSNTSFPQSVQLRSFLPFLITGLVLFRCYLIAFVPSMLKPNSAEALFRRARQKGAENNKDIIDDVEIKKELQPATKRGYRRALAFWH